MKKTVFTLSIIFILTSVFGQRTEFRLGFNSGLFAFVGKSSNATSFINNSSSIHAPYTNNPYGSQNGICYGISGNLKRVTKKNFIFGFDLGYERVRSQVTINEVNDYSTAAIFQYQARGKTYLNVNFINTQLFAGYRVVLKPLHFDITGGVDIGRCLQAKEKGSADAINGINYKTAVDRKTIKTDIRPRIQLSADYKKFGAYVGYSRGLTSYKSGYDGGANDCFSRVFRFGLTYLIL
jgi:hypothetical protein